MQPKVDFKILFPCFYREGGVIEDGARIGSAFGHFLAWIAKEVRDRQAKRIYFLSSEGQWFARVYSLMRERLPEGKDLPPGVHLAVSRRSTYLASFERLDADIASPLLGQYRGASIRAVLGSLGYFAIAAPGQLERLAGSFDLEAPWTGDGPEVLRSPLVRPILNRYRNTQRGALLAYLSQHGFGQEQSRAVVIDIGWRGSIQDNLARLKPEMHWHGLYYHLQPFFVPQAGNVSKGSFLLPGGHGPPGLTRRLRFASPLEFAAKHSAKTVLSYARGDGAVEPVYERFCQDRKIGPADKLRQFRSTVTRSALATSLYRKCDAEAALAETLRYLERPSAATIELFFAEFRKNSFGAGPVPVQSGATRIGISDLLGALISGAHRTRLGWKLTESHWPWGLLRRDLPGFASVVIWALRHTDARLHDPTSPARAKRINARIL